MAESDWSLEESRGIRLLRCVGLSAVRPVAHAFSTRVAFGRTDFDLGSDESEEAETRSRRTAFFDAAGLGRAQPAKLRQVHGGIIVDAAEGRLVSQAADGAIRVARHGDAVPVPVVRTADCVAILLVDRNATAVAALHAGWRGAAAGIAAKGVARFANEGVEPRELIAALGPAILGCCFEVGEEVVTALDRVTGDRSAWVDRSVAGRIRVDLHAALREQLSAAGVRPESIHAAPWCTRCRTDLFFSFRGEGPGTGRLLAAVGPAVGP